MCAALSARRKPLAGKKSRRGVGIDVPLRFFDTMVLDLHQEISIRLQLGHQHTGHPVWMVAEQQVEGGGVEGDGGERWWLKGKGGLTPPLEEWRARSPALAKLLADLAEGRLADDPDQALHEAVMQSAAEWFHPLLRSWLARCGGKCDINRQVSGWVGLYGAGSFNVTLAHILGRHADAAGIQILKDGGSEAKLDLSRVDSNGNTPAQLAALGNFEEAAAAIKALGAEPLAGEGLEEEVVRSSALLTAPLLPHCLVLLCSSEFKPAVVCSRWSSGLRTSGQRPARRSPTRSGGKTFGRTTARAAGARRRLTAETTRWRSRRSLGSTRSMPTSADPPPPALPPSAAPLSRRLLTTSASRRSQGGRAHLHVQIPAAGQAGDCPRGDGQLGVGRQLEEEGLPEEVRL